MAETLEFKAVEVESWAAFKQEVAEKDGVKYLRKAGGSVIYKKVDSRYICNDCGETIMARSVAHPIWDGPFPCSGRCHYEDVPYCPKCEKEPSFDGEPIEVGKQFFKSR